MSTAINDILHTLNRELHVLSTLHCLPVAQDELCYFEGQLQLALSTVHTLKNASGPAINRFPQEVLALIPTHFDPAIPWDTLNASHVCRYWRTALVSSPALWSVTDSTSMTAPLVELYLDRSRASPLDVTLGEATTAHILQQFVDRAPQIGSLSSVKMSWARWRAVSERFSVSALPTLLNLHIFATTQTDSTAPDSALFPQALNLRHLSIKISGPSAPIWSHLAFPSLTNIQISCWAGGGRRFRMTVGQLLGVLRSSPLLEDAHLKIDSLTTEPGVPHRSVPLPRLRKLSMSCSPTPVPILASITFPPAACILVLAHEGPQLWTHDSMVSLGQHLSPLVSGSDELIFYATDYYNMSTLHFKRDGETRIEFEYRVPGGIIPLEETFAFVTASPLDAIRRFVIGGRKIQRDVANDQVSRAIRNMRSIETLVLINTPHLLPLLLPAIHDGQLPCPTLETLAIDDNQEIPRKELVQVAKARAEAGFPLQRVILRTGYSEEVAGELCQFVGSVEHGEDVEFEC